MDGYNWSIMRNGDGWALSRGRTRFGNYGTAEAALEAAVVAASLALQEGHPVKVEATIGRKAVKPVHLEVRSSAGICSVDRQGIFIGTYGSREAALETAAALAKSDLIEGHSIILVAPGRPVPGK
jgi:hypothetical protein